MKHLDAAEDAIRSDADLATVTRDEHMAVIRRWRGVRSLHAGNPAMADVCIRVMQQRYESTGNESIGDQLHALRGTWLVEQRKYQEAIPELEQASDDAFSLDLLARTKRESGDAPGADATLRRLFAIHASTMDSVLVVEPARQKSAVSANCFDCPVTASQNWSRTQEELTLATGLKSSLRSVSRMFAPTLSARATQPRSRSLERQVH